MTLTWVLKRAGVRHGGTSRVRGPATPSDPLLLPPSLPPPRSLFEDTGSPAERLRRPDHTAPHRPIAFLKNPALP